MINAEAFGEQAVLRFNHIEIAVARKPRVHSVTRLARFPVAYAIRQDDEKFRRVQRLIFPEQFAGKFRPNKLRAATGRPVHDENRIRCFPLRVFLWFTQRPVMDAQFGQCFG